MNAVSWILVSALALSAAVPAGAAKTPAVAHMDTHRFAGTWYQLARLDSGAQTGVEPDCATDVTAHYEPRPDGTLKVTNSCRTPTGKLETDVGIAHLQANDSRHAAHWKVSYMPHWLQWLPVGQNEVWVVMLDPSYRFAVISDADRHNLWLLSRSPSLPADDLGRIVDRLAADGYPTGQLVLTRQSAVVKEIGSEQAVPFTGRPRLMVQQQAAQQVG